MKAMMEEIQERGGEMEGEEDREGEEDDKEGEK